MHQTYFMDPPFHKTPTCSKYVPIMQSYVLSKAFTSQPNLSLHTDKKLFYRKGNLIFFFFKTHVILQNLFRVGGHFKSSLLIGYNINPHITEHLAKNHLIIIYDLS